MLMQRCTAVAAAAGELDCQQWKGRINVRTRPRRQFSEGRKATYYIGTGLMVIGVLLFMSTFVTFCMHFGDVSDFDGRARSSMARALGGMALMVIGGIVRGIGSRGLAGSGVILDPEQAREDVEPWSRMAGGITNDTLSEIEPVQKIVDAITGDDDEDEPTEVVKVRCRKCRTLNDEDARFCDQCGEAM
jgi:hypothetical protein